LIFILQRLQFTKIDFVISLIDLFLLNKMPTNIQDIPIVLSYDAIVIAPAKKKRLSMLKKLPKKVDISALALISRYLGKN
jgi:hypothetical protein